MRNIALEELEKCLCLLDKLAEAIKRGRVPANTAHAILVRVNDYLNILEDEEVNE